MELDRHEIGPPAALIDNTECGEAAHRWQRSKGVDRVLVCDQAIVGSGGIRSGHTAPILTEKG
jgi:hypothetical protein